MVVVVVELMLLASVSEELNGMGSTPGGGTLNPSQMTM